VKGAYMLRDETQVDCEYEQLQIHEETVTRHELQFREIVSRQREKLYNIHYITKILRAEFWRDFKILERLMERSFHVIFVGILRL